LSARPLPPLLLLLLLLLLLPPPLLQGQFDFSTNVAFKRRRASGCQGWPPVLPYWRSVTFKWQCVQSLVDLGPWKGSFG